MIRQGEECAVIDVPRVPLTAQISPGNWGVFIAGVDSPEVNRIQRKLEKPRDEFLCVANKHWKR